MECRRPIISIVPFTVTFIIACKDFHFLNNYTIKLIHLFYEKKYIKLKEKINIYSIGIKANIYVTNVKMKNSIY